MSFLKRLKDKFQPKTDQPHPEEQESLESQSEALDDGLISIEEFEEWEQEQIGYKFKAGLEKSREKFQNEINELMARYRTVDEDFFEALEEVLISADVGFNTVMELTDELRHEAKVKNITETADLRETIVEKMVEIYERNDDLPETVNMQDDELTVILVVGVNGVGKTTTIGKLAHKYRQEGKSVMLAAGIHSVQGRSTSCRYGGTVSASMSSARRRAATLQR